MLPLALILAFVACSFGKLLGDSGLERLARRVAGSVSRARCAPTACCCLCEVGEELEPDFLRLNNNNYDSTYPYP